MNSRRTWAFIRFGLTTLFLFVVWILISSDAGPFSLLFGLVVCLLTSALSMRQISTSSSPGLSPCFASFF